MNKSLNLKFVYNCGDALQLEFGPEFGSYAKLIDNEKMTEFIIDFNNNPWVYQHGYYLSIVPGKTGHLSTKLFNRTSNLNACVRFMDHSAYIEACDYDWSKIDKNLFLTLQKAWREFLSKNVNEYESHIDKTLVLSQLDPIAAL